MILLFILCRQKSLFLSECDLTCHTDQHTTHMLRDLWQNDIIPFDSLSPSWSSYHHLWLKLVKLVIVCHHV